MADEDDAYRRDPRALALGARLRSPRRGGLTLWRYRWVTLILPLLGAAAFLLWARRAEHEAGFVAKGGGLEIVVERQGRVSPWDGSPLRKDDRLQLALTTSKSTHVAVLAREGRDVIQLYPEQGGSSESPAPGEHVPLGGSFRTDGTALRLYVFDSPAAFEIEPLRAAITAGSVPGFAGKLQIVELPGTTSP
jgi:hypothetical protein